MLVLMNFCGGFDMNMAEPGIHLSVPGHIYVDFFTLNPIFYDEYYGYSAYKRFVFRAGAMLGHGGKNKFDKQVVWLGFVFSTNSSESIEFSEIELSLSRPLLINDVSCAKWYRQELFRSLSIVNSFVRYFAAPDNPAVSTCDGFRWHRLEGSTAEEESFLSIGIDEKWVPDKINLCYLSVAVLNDAIVLEDGVKLKLKAFPIDRATKFPINKRVMINNSRSVMMWIPVRCNQDLISVTGDERRFFQFYASWDQKPGKAPEISCCARIASRYEINKANAEYCVRPAGANDPVLWSSYGCPMFVVQFKSLQIYCSGNVSYVDIFFQLDDREEREQVLLFQIVASVIFGAMISTTLSYSLSIVSKHIDGVLGFIVWGFFSVMLMVLSGYLICFKLDKDRKLFIRR